MNYLMRLMVVLTLSTVGTMAFAAPLGKPGANVRILSEQTLAVDVDRQQTVAVRFTPPAEGELMALTLTKADGLQVVSPQRQWQFDHQGAEIELQLHADVAGTYNVHFLARTWKAEQPEFAQTRSLGLRVNAGKVAPLSAQIAREKADTGVSVRADGTRVIRQSAQETVLNGR